MFASSRRTRSEAIATQFGARGMSLCLQTEKVTLACVRPPSTESRSDILPKTTRRGPQWVDDPEVADGQGAERLTGQCHSISQARGELPRRWAAPLPGVRNEPRRRRQWSEAMVASSSAAIAARLSWRRPRERRQNVPVPARRSAESPSTIRPRIAVVAAARRQRQRRARHGASSKLCIGVSPRNSRRATRATTPFRRASVDHGSMNASRT